MILSLKRLRGDKAPPGSPVSNALQIGRNGNQPDLINSLSSSTGKGSQAVSEVGLLNTPALGYD